MRIKADGRGKPLKQSMFTGDQNRVVLKIGTKLVQQLLHDSLASNTEREALAQE